MNKHEPHFACAGCADLQSFPADHLRTHGGDLWCDDCWHGFDKDTETGIEYTDLPQFIPEADLKIQALTEGLRAIKQHLEMMGAGKLSTTWQIADTALNKAEVECNRDEVHKARDQRNELAAALVEVNEFCQLRGIGKVGDSASAALMQRYDELAAQVERLRGVIVDATNHGAQLDNGCWVYSIDDSVLSEQPPAALTALKAQWQAEAVDRCEKEVTASVNGLFKPHIAGVFAVIRQRAQEAGDVSRD